MNQSGVGAIVGYADYKDTADINRILNMKEVKEVLPRDLKLMWGVRASDMDKTDVFSNCMQSNLPSATDVRRWKGDVITDARDSYDQYNRPCVTMAMNTEGARRWAQLTKQNTGREIAIVLDGYVYSAPRSNGEIAEVILKSQVASLLNRQKTWPMC